MKSGEKQTMRGIVLAGVHAWGESALERICPRPLLPIAGRPLVWYSLDWLARGGIGRVTLCANSDTPALQACLGDGSRLGMALDFYEDVMPRGPAGCARDAAQHRNADLYVVIEGTLLPRIELGALLAAHRDSCSAVTVVASRRGGNGDDRLEPAGIYVISRPALELVPPKGYQDIKEMWIPRLYQHGFRTKVFAAAEATLPVRGVADYRGALVHVLSEIERTAEWGRGYRRSGSALLHPSAQVAASVRLSGQVLIGPCATIEARATILGPTILGPNAQVGASAVLSEMIAWSGCRVGRGAILHRCLLLDDSIIEPGLIVRDAVWGTDQARDFCGRQMENYWAFHGVDVGANRAQDPQPQDDAPSPSPAGDAVFQPRLSPCDSWTARESTAAEECILKPV
ncbi:MAG: NDP-sugar synthase [Phycisphaerae bacterium]|jgi:NDP-sugar pyrophosphorylase family protein